jgi:hypothetical protein
LKLPRRSVILLFAILAASAACKRPHHSDAVAPEQAAAEASVVNVSDPDAPAQLVRGFYSLESNSWRWAARKFTVALKTPPGAASKGARLTLKFNLPGVVVQKVGPIKITASIGGTIVGSQEFATPGDGTLTLTVPASALAADAVSVDFECDKALPPTGDDARELALVVTSIGLETQ